MDGSEEVLRVFRPGVLKLTTAAPPVWGGLHTSIPISGPHLSTCQGPAKKWASTRFHSLSTQGPLYSAHNLYPTTLDSLPCTHLPLSSHACPSRVPGLLLPLPETLTGSRLLVHVLVTQSQHIYCLVHDRPIAL